MRLLPFVFLLAVAGCAAHPGAESWDRSSHVGRVVDDVTAILEGMAEAHADRPFVLREPPTAQPDGSRAKN